MLCVYILAMSCVVDNGVKPPLITCIDYGCSACSVDCGRLLYTLVAVYLYAGPFKI